ncbi:Trm112 family protein [Mucilaginibacter defluvii]|uniref:Trm112p-like protein n=1 Tax=Mucilaginibacter defluvii TaxID=1196019 RepID=A0ABP9FSI8_9SPHI
MKINTINKLCCPFDKQDLQLKILAQDTGKNVIEGLLSCKCCSRVYPIVYGVPIMAPDEYRQIQVEQPIIERWRIEYKLDPLNLLPG